MSNIQKIMAGIIGTLLLLFILLIIKVILDQYSSDELMWTAIFASPFLLASLIPLAILITNQGRSKIVNYIIYSLCIAGIGIALYPFSLDEGYLLFTTLAAAPFIAILILTVRMSAKNSQ